MKTARFSEMIARAGPPRLYTLWVPPKEDREFQRALKAHRILTVHEVNVGTRKDHGEVGFHPKGHVQFLVFPRSLKPFGGKRIVGIDFDRVKDADVPVSPRAPQDRRPSKRPSRKNVARKKGPRRASGS